MENKTVYNFYYTRSEIVDHDNDGAVYEYVRTTLGAFEDFNSGLEYFRHKYPHKTIHYEIVKILDIFEE